jgi:hypothetical protein
LFLLADKPEMQPLKDYDDYTTFINGQYQDDKSSLMSRAHETIERRKGSMNLTAPVSICLSNVNSPQARTTIEFPRSSVPVTTMNPRFKEIQKYLSGIIKPTNQTQRPNFRQPRTRTMRGFAQNTDPELKPAILETRIS